MSIVLIPTFSEVKPLYLSPAGWERITTVLIQLNVNPQLLINPAVTTISPDDAKAMGSLMHDALHKGKIKAYMKTDPGEGEPHAYGLKAPAVEIKFSRPLNRYESDAYLGAANFMTDCGGFEIKRRDTSSDN
ncbi:MAG: hypothetical protein EOP06_03820 [Proteobacteria bacterium]|nr:MAG: hypothetical protein EOP06_03820 [Pseudomonadota bacterium]